MKQLLIICLSLLSLSPFSSALAWNNNMDAMNTMSNNMSQPIIRKARAYSGEFKGWRFLSYTPVYTSNSYSYSSSYSQQSYESFENSVSSECKPRWKYSTQPANSDVCVVNCNCEQPW